jgi:glycosyltransferase involved in cell wall biosynthesis
MRVAVFSENFLPKLDGVTRTLAMLLESLQRLGHQALLFAPAGGPREYAGAHIVGARGVPLPFYPELKALFPSPRFADHLAAFRPDVVHAAEPMLLGAAGIRWGRRLRIPIVASYHTNLADYCSHFHLGALARGVWAYRRALHRQCALTLAPSESTRRELVRHGFPRVAVWQRGVDSALFVPSRRSQAWRQSVAGDASRTVILYVGRLSHEKNLPALVEAYKRMASERLHLAVVGDGPARPELERTLAGYQATFTGYLRGEALAEAYASADIFAFPSLTETFGQVVNEAMASGLPVLAYDADGVRDQVEHGRTGLLVRPSDRAGFAEGLSLLALDADLRRALGARAREVAATRRWEAVMDDLMRIYEDLGAQQLPAAA